ncbi:MAG: hypothetical protein QGI09_04090 [Dehalococcoidia bacterium]|nr:hypothetical protein [Dehalococcoidia bacterium]
MKPADLLQSRLDAGEVVIMDGGTGTEIKRRGVPLCPETWSGRASLTHLDLIRHIHEACISQIKLIPLNIGPSEYREV